MERALIGTVDELQARGVLTGKVGSHPVCVFWSDDRAYAVDDRCPHMGFPLHRGTVENGLLTCHWHHARFDLQSGGTLEPFADDVPAHTVEIEGSNVHVVVEARSDPLAHYLRRLEDGLQHELTLVTAKAVLGILTLLGPDEGSAKVIKTGVEFGTRNRVAGWGTGLTVLAAMSNVLGVLSPEDRALALVHGLAFVARDTAGQPPRFALDPLDTSIAANRLSSWYRQFVETRNGDAAERVLSTAVAGGSSAAQLAELMTAAVTDHVFVDGGHTIDFTNKAFEVLDVVGWESAVAILPTLVPETTQASRSEESGSWRHPQDLPSLLLKSEARAHVRAGGAPAPFDSVADVDALAWVILSEDPTEIIDRLDADVDRGASLEEIARAVAYAAALRLVRFHTQNDHGDWDVVHHGFTAANATHQLICRAPSPELARGVYQTAMKVFLDRFLNVPAARLPVHHPLADGTHDLSELAACWDRDGMVDEAGAIVYGWLSAGKDQASVIATLGSALLAEDAGFHWYQTFEAAVRQAGAWPPGSEQSALILTAAARFLAAHTPTRRELTQVVRIATRLRRGDALYEEM